MHNIDYLYIEVECFGKDFKILFANKKDFNTFYRAVFNGIFPRYNSSGYAVYKLLPSKIINTRQSRKFIETCSFWIDLKMFKANQIEYVVGVNVNFIVHEALNFYYKHEGTM